MHLKREGKIYGPITLHEETHISKISIIGRQYTHKLAL
jgi:hypothetical protein